MLPCGPPSSTLAQIYQTEFWGLFSSTILFGISLQQGFHYYANTADKWFMKAFVAVILVLDIATTAQIAQTVSYYMIDNAGDESAATLLTNTFIGEIATSIVTVFLSQQFYASRIYGARRSRGRYIYGWVASSSISVLSVIGCGAGLAEVVKLFRSDHRLSNLLYPTFRTPVTVFAFVGALDDAIATFSMCYYLSSYRPSINSTKHVLSRLIYFSINRGFLLCVNNVIFISLLIGRPSDSYWVPFHFFIPKFHAITFLAMINSKSEIRSQMAGRVTVFESRPSTVGRQLCTSRLQGIMNSGLDESTPRTPDKIFTRHEIQPDMSSEIFDRVHNADSIELGDIKRGSPIA